MAPPADVPRPVRRIVVLHRSESAATRLEPLGPEEALASLLRGAWSKDDRLSPEGFSGLVACVNGAESLRLHYSDLASAVTALDRDWTRPSAGVPRAS